MRGAERIVKSERGNSQGLDLFAAVKKPYCRLSSDHIKYKVEYNGARNRWGYHEKEDIFCCGFIPFGNSRMFCEEH